MRHLTAVQVRRATPEDVPWLLTQLRDFAAAYPARLRVMGADDFAEDYLGVLIREQYVAIAERDGQPVGLIAGVCAPHPMNPDLMLATELFWFVPLAHRGTRAGLLLLNDFESWVGEAGADCVNFTLEAGSPVNARILEKRGYVLAETQYLRAMPSLVS